MEKTKFPTASSLMKHQADIEGQIRALELRVRDFMAIFAAIAFTQDDKKFSVPLGVIEQINGASVDFSFNKVTKEYEFTYVAAAPAPEQPAAEEPAPGGLILPASAHPSPGVAIADPLKPLEGEVNL